MNLGLKDKNAVVLAGSSGFGFETASVLAEEGCSVIICGRDQSRLDEAVASIAQKGKGKIMGIPADVSEKKSLEYFWKNVFDSVPGVDVLVTNAGGPPAKFFHETNDVDWQKAFELNLMSVVHSIRAVLPHMSDQKWGRIVNITSVTVKQPKPELVLSNAIRAGVINLAKTLATEYGSHNILVNNVAPGFHATPALQRVIEKNARTAGVTVDEMERKMSDSIPLGRIGKPEEMAYLIAYLVSERNSYLTGQTIVHDGGFIQTI